MGNQTPKPRAVLKRFDIEVTCNKIYHHLELVKNRKINELATREKTLRDSIKAGKRTYPEVLVEMITIVNLFKTIRAAKIIMRYCTIIKEHSLQIVDASRNKNMASIWDLETYFQGIIWSADKLNLTYIKEFNNLIFRHFGPEVFREMQSFTKVDKDLRTCFASIEPTPNEIRDYLEQFCKRYDINDFSFGGKKKSPSPKKKSGNSGFGGYGKKEEENLDELIKNLTSKPGLDEVESEYKPKEPSYKQPSQHSEKDKSDFRFAPEEDPNKPLMSGLNKQSYMSEKKEEEEKMPSNFNYPEESEVQQHSIKKLSEVKQDHSKISINFDQNGEEHTDQHEKDLTDQHIKDIIESNIGKSYFKVKKSETDKKEAVVEDNIDALISNLKDLGVTNKKFNGSNVKYDAQKYYDQTGEENDYSLNLSKANKDN